MKRAAEYDRKYPKITVFARELHVFGKSVDVVCQTVAKKVGFRQPMYNDDCGMYLRSLEEYIK